MSLSNSQFSRKEPVLGFIYQVRYALRLLFGAKADTGHSAEITVEGIDDIDVGADGTTTHLVQTKRTITALTDASAPLWKTLRVWSVAVANGDVDLDEMDFTLVTTSGTSDDGIVSFLQGGDDPEQSALNRARALAELRRLASANRDQKSLGPAYRAFDDLSAVQQEQLVSRISIETDAPDFEELDATISNQLMCGPPNQRDTAAELLFGRWHRLVEHNLLEDERRPITFDDLQWVIHEIHKSLQDDSLPTDLPVRIETVFPPLAQDTSQFLEQMRAVRATPKQLAMAREDHTLTKQLQSYWLRKGLLLPDEKQAYDRLLARECDLMHQQMDGEQSFAIEDEKVPEQDGYRVLSWALTDAPHKPTFHIRKHCTRPDVVRGTFHDLADMSDPKLGWHPSWRVLFGDSEEDLLDAG